MKTAEPIFVTVKEAARLLGISPWTCYQLLKSGDIESRYLGRRRLIPLVALMKYAACLPTTREESA